MTFTKRFKTAIVSILSAISLFTLVFGFFASSLFVKATAESSTQAYLMHIDPDTDAVWYSGETGKVKENRYYGKEGYVWFLVNAMEKGNGQPVTDIDVLNDMSPGDTKANRVELPSYVSKVVTDFKSTRDTPHGYWSDLETLSDRVEKSQNSANSSIYYGKNLIPLDPAEDERIQSAVWHTRETTTVDIHFNDDEWHQVSIYVGDGYSHRNDYFENTIGILDMNGKLIAETVVPDARMHSWVTFAVKGSFSFLHQGNPGGISMISFDPLEDDPTVGAKNFKGERTGVATVNLSWENVNSNSITKIYRREKGETMWNLLASTEAGATTYVDNDTNAASTYEYILGSGILTRHTEEDANHYNLANIVPTTYKGNIPDESALVSVETAPYSLTKLEFDKSHYEFSEGKKWQARVTAYVQNESTGEYEIYPNANIQFSLDGEHVFTTSNGVTKPNMNTDLGTFTTNAQGFVRFSYEPEYVGDYTVQAYLAPVPDPDDPEHGTAKSYATASFKSSAEVVEYAPYLQTVSDAIKPGDTLTISGNNIAADSSLKIAMAPNAGVAPAAFDEENQPNNIRYFDVDDLLVTDSVYESGLMFIMPKDMAAGSYDLWVRNDEGWSNGITLNAARPLYISQDTVYAGQQIEIAGRNFLVSDFGIGNENDAYGVTKIKLQSKQGATSYELDVLTGVRIKAEDTLLEKKVDIMHSNPYKLTFVVPDTVAYGEYDVYVAANGVDFRPLNAPQTLTVEEKKAQNWNTEVFGNDYASHLGNDPLDLRVSWAQHLNYTNVKTMTPNQAPTVEEGKLTDTSSASALTQEVNNAITELSENGGGIVYFPEGTYYLTPRIMMKEKIILVGAGIGKTYFSIVMTDVNGHFISGPGDNGSNMGLARIEFAMHENSVCNPDFVVSFGSSSHGLQMLHSPAYSENKFVTDCKFTMFGEAQYKGSNSRGMVGLNCYKNMLYQNNIYLGGINGLYAAYHDEYAIVRNSYIHMTGEGQSVSCSANYSFLENMYAEMDYWGHGYALRSDAYIGNCFITKTGTEHNSHNIGEMILCEPPGGYFSTGYILDADARGFTAALRDSTTEVNSQTRLNYNYFAIYISEGKGAGQMRYFKCDPTNEYGNSYEFLDEEEDWDIIPDTTSIFSIFCPMEGLTVYRFQGTDNKKAIFLYNCMLDAVVAECDLWDTEGIGVFSGDVSDERFLPSRNIRIENNKIDGISRLTGKGGIGLLTQRSASRVSNGAQLMNISIRGNVLTNTRPYDGTTIFGKDENGDLFYIGSSEYPDYDGIVIWTQKTEGVDTSGDARFIIIENNKIDNSEYGVYCDNRVTGIVIRNNEIGKTDSGVDVTYFAPNGLHIVNTHTLYVDGAVSKLSGEYYLNAELPTLANEGDKVFFGWSLTETYDPTVGVTTKGLDSNVTLYAVYGYEVTFDLNYTKNNGESVFNTIKVMEGENVATAVTSFGDPFRVGYEFGGWYVDEACTEEFDTSDVITKSMTVYAKWIDENAEPTTSDSEEPAWGIDCSGCFGTIDGASIALCAIALGGVKLLRKKRK